MGAMKAPKVAKSDTQRPETPGPSTRKPSQADAAHIATAEYGRELKSAADRIGKLKALRLAQEAKESAKPKPKKKAASKADRPRTTAYRRWGV